MSSTSICITPATKPVQVTVFSVAEEQRMSVTRLEPFSATHYEKVYPGKKIVIEEMAD